MARDWAVYEQAIGVTLTPSHHETPSHHDERKHVAKDRVVALEVGCHPEAAISGGLLLQSEQKVFLLFNAMSDEPNAQGLYEDVGTAVMEFKTCFLTRFGYPNDEGRPEHALYQQGLAAIDYRVCEVLNSSWASAEGARRRRSAERIWSARFQRASQNYEWTSRHFLVAFHDSTFECLAADFQVTIHPEPYAQVLDGLVRRLMAP
jgi:hypothetical protein